MATAMEKPSIEEIFDAIKQGNLSLVEELLSNFPEVISEVNLDHEEATIFIYAAECRQKEIIKTLLKYNPDLNSTNQYGMSALHFATKNIDFEMCELLLDAGAAMVKGLCGTPILLSVAKGNMGLIKLLVSRGADLHDENLIVESIVYSKHFLLKYFIDIGCDINKQTDGIHPLHVASAKGDIRSIRVLLEKGAGPFIDSVDVNGSTSLMIATKTGHTDVVECLLNHGANVNVRDNSYSKLTSLHYASYLDKTDCLHLLLKHGANPNISDLHGFTALTRAISASSHDVIIILLKENADVNICGTPVSFNDRLCSPLSPLELAIQTKQYVLAKLLLYWNIKYRFLCRAKQQLLKDEQNIDNEILLAITNKLENPSRLIDITRTRIRQALGCPVCERICELPLPLTLKQHLQYSEECKRFMYSAAPRKPRGAFAQCMPSQWINHDENIYAVT